MFGPLQESHCSRCPTKMLLCCALLLCFHFLYAAGAAVETVNSSGSVAAPLQGVVNNDSQVLLLPKTLQNNSTLPQVAPKAVAADCRAPGLQCSLQCRELIMCLQNHTGPQYLPLTVTTCSTSAGSFCNLENRDCSSKYCDDEAIRIQPFICRQVGKFPDPFDCTRSHICNRLDDISVISVCGAGSSYDAKTEACVKGNDTRACRDGPMEKCTEVGQFGMLEDNPRYFFLCRRSTTGYLLPNMYICPVSTVFDKENYECRGSASGMAASTAALLLAVLASRLLK